MQREGADSVYKDYLTQLYNRRFFKEVGPKLVEQARRYDRPFSVIILDINGFKGVNDILGHEHGDRVLQEIAEELRRSRPSDFWFRWGGDEFLCLLPETSHQKAKILAERIARLLKARNISISLGVSSWRKDVSSLNALVGLADEKMYEQKKKRNGKGLRRTSVA